MPSKARKDGRGHVDGGNHVMSAAPTPSGEVRIIADSPRAGDLAATLSSLRELNGQRLLAQRARMRGDRAIEDMLAHLSGMRSDTPKGERAPFYKAAAEMRRKIEGGKGDAPAHTTRMVLASAASAREWERLENELGRVMAKAAAALPVAKWCEENLRGFGPMQLAILVANLSHPEDEVGRIGAMTDYETKERVWKRLGLAVIDGERQRRVGGDAAMAHGYAPERRSAVWVMAESFFKQQGSVAKGNATRYRLAYEARRAHTLPRVEMTKDLPFTHAEKWTPKRCHADAVRVMSKLLLEDIWKAWRGAIMRLDTSGGMPLAAPSQVAA